MLGIKPETRSPNPKNPSIYSGSNFRNPKFIQKFWVCTLRTRTTRITHITQVYWPNPLVSSPAAQKPTLSPHAHEPHLPTIVYSNSRIAAQPRPRPNLYPDLASRRQRLTRSIPCVLPSSLETDMEECRAGPFLRSSTHASKQRRVDPLHLFLHRTQ